MTTRMIALEDDVIDLVVDQLVTDAAGAMAAGLRGTGQILTIAADLIEQQHEAQRDMTREPIELWPAVGSESV